jgi:hypothetical protein
LKRVEIALRKGLEFVIVTLGALHRQAQQRGAHNLHGAFEHCIFVGPLLVGIPIAAIGAVGAVAQVVGSFEQFDHFGSDIAVGSVTGEFVPRQLLADELVPRFVGVDRTDHIVAITISQRTIGIGEEIAVAVCIAGGIEPVFAPALAITRRSEIAFDHLFVGAIVVVVYKLLDLFWRRRQTDKIESHAADERVTVCFWTDLQAVRFKFLLNKPVDRQAKARGIANFRQLRQANFLKCPMFVAIGLGRDICRQATGAVGNPAAQQFLLFRRKRLVFRHFVGGHALPKRTFVGLARHDNLAVFAAAGDARRQGKIQLSLLLCRPMTTHAAIFEQRQNVVLEIGRRLLLARAKRSCQQNSKKNCNGRWTFHGCHRASQRALALAFCR